MVISLGGGDKHRGSKLFTQAVVLGVLDQPDNFINQRGLARRRFNLKSFADRVMAVGQLTDKGFIDDRDFWPRERIVVIEIPPRDHRGAERLKKIRRDLIEHRDALLDRIGPQDFDRVVPAAAAHRHNHSVRRRIDAGNGANSIEQISLVSEAPIFRELEFGKIELRHHDPVLFKTRVYAHDFLQTAREEERASQ
jgi:hypothetical protein